MLNDANLTGLYDQQNIQARNDAILQKYTKVATTVNANTSSKSINLKRLGNNNAILHIILNESEAFKNLKQKIKGNMKDQGHFTISEAILQDLQTA